MHAPDSFQNEEEAVQERNVFLLNRREYNRYLINNLPAGDIGHIVEISRGGLRIEKTGSADIEASEVIVPIADEEVKAVIVWQNRKYIGLQYADDFDADQQIKNRTKKIMEPVIEPLKKVSDDDIAAITPKELLSSCIILMTELEEPDASLHKLRIFIEKISDACRGTTADVKDTPGEAGEITETGTFIDLKEQLLNKANQVFSSREIKITDIDFAMARMGLDKVKEISSDILSNIISEVEIPLKGFDNYIPFTVLKAVIFRNLTHFFNFNDKGGDGSLLLCLETKGIDVLIRSGGKEAEDYFISPRRIYSQLSRTYENISYGNNLLFINKLCFENELGLFEDIYDGYILAHLTLHPEDTLRNNIKLDLTKRKLLYAFLAYMTFLAAGFIIDKDRECGCILISRLKKTGMDSSKILDFLNDCIGKANEVLKNLGLTQTIRRVSLPYSSFKVDRYLLKDNRFRYFIKSLENFSILKSVTRMAIRYEDHAYTHFILSKFLIAEEYSLNSKIYCVIPCINISDKDLYIGDFYYFDLLIFKDIDRLPGRHIKEFIKLWNSFEGKIIVTFSNYSYLDIDYKYLYLFLKKHIVDFPSYFSDPAVYEKMIVHVINNMKLFTGDREIDKNKYLTNIFSMDYITSAELRPHS